MKQDYTHSPSSWIDLWKDPVYLAYCTAMQNTLGAGAKVTAGALKLKPSLRYGDYIAPIYGDAREALINEQDPTNRQHILNYIAYMQKLFIVQSLNKEREYNALSHFQQTRQLPPSSLATTRHPIVYIRVLPVNMHGTKPSSPIVAPVVDKKKRQPKKEKILKDKPAKKSSNSPKQASSNDKILTKSLTGKFPFSKKGECKSSTRTAKHYMSKAALVDLIKSDAHLKSKVGPKYASLTKEQICEKLFE